MANLRIILQTGVLLLLLAHGRVDASDEAGVGEAYSEAERAAIDLGRKDFASIHQNPFRRTTIEVIVDGKKTVVDIEAENQNKRKVILDHILPIVLSRPTLALGEIEELMGVLNAERNGRPLTKYLLETPYDDYHAALAARLIDAQYIAFLELKGPFPKLETNSGWLSFSGFASEIELPFFYHGGDSWYPLDIHRDLRNQFITEPAKKKFYYYPELRAKIASRVFKYTSTSENSSAFASELESITFSLEVAPIQEKVMAYLKKEGLASAGERWLGPVLAGSLEPFEILQMSLRAPHPAPYGQKLSAIKKGSAFEFEVRPAEHGDLDASWILFLEINASYDGKYPRNSGFGFIPAKLLQLE